MKKEIVRGAAVMSMAALIFGCDGLTPDSSTEPIEFTRSAITITPCDTPPPACADMLETPPALSTWPNGTIYYQFDSTATADEKNWVRLAMNDWETVANHVITFTFNTTSPQRLTIHPNKNSPVNGSNYAYPYKTCVDNPQGASAPPPDASDTHHCAVWAGAGQIYHELGHAIGFVHEWVRNDRRHFVHQNDTNLHPGCTGISGRYTNADFDFGPFDFTSTMMYQIQHPDLTRWDGTALCAGSTCAAQACVTAPVAGCPGGKCPSTCTPSPPGTTPIVECPATAQPEGYPTLGDGSNVVELYSLAGGWKRFLRAVNESTSGTGATTPWNNDLASSVTISLTKSLAVNTWESGSLSLFVTGNDDHVYGKSKTGSSWSTWSDSGTPPGTGSVSDPAVVSWASGRTDLVVRKGAVIYIKTFSNNAWGSWGSIGAPPSTPASSPTITSWGVNRLDVFVRSSDDAVYWKSCTANCNGNAGSWSSWISLGAAIRGKPAAVSRANGKISLFVHGMDDHLWENDFANSMWGGWFPGAASGVLAWDANTPDAFSPAATSRGSDTMDVLIRGVDNQVWITTMTGSTWSPYAAIGGVLTSSPATVSSVRSSNRIDLAVLMAEARVGGGSSLGPWWKEYSP